MHKKAKKSLFFKLFYKIQQNRNSIYYYSRVTVTHGPGDGNQKKMTAFFTSEKVLVNHNKETFKAAIVHMAVNNAISLRFFSEESFQMLNGEIARKLQGVILEHL